MLPNSTRVACPLVTPFDEEGAVDHDALASLVEHLVESGIDGLVPCGTTGEFASLTPTERRDVIETTVEAAPPDVPVVAGASATAVESARDRVAEAESAGADATLVLPPYYLEATSPAGNRQFFEAVAEDSPLPIYLYNIPAYTGNEVAPETAAALAEHGSIVGMKDSSGDLTHVERVLARVPPDFQIFQGWDAVLVPGVYAGMTGGVNALSHLIGPAMLDAVEAVRAGDHERARSIQRERIGPLFSALSDHGFAPGVKVALADAGIIPSPAVRPPLTLPDEDGRAEIEEASRRASEGSP